MTHINIKQCKAIFNNFIVFPNRALQKEASDSRLVHATLFMVTYVESILLLIYFKFSLHLILTYVLSLSAKVRNCLSFFIYTNLKLTCDYQGC